MSPDRWWTSFGDPRLSEWVDRALAGNVPLARAWSRLEQARIAAALAGADARPTLSAEASARRSRIAPGSLGRPSPAATFNQFTLGFAAAYEVDLWGRVAATVRAAEADLTASRLDLEAAAMTLAAEVAEAWLAICEHSALLALLRTQQQVSADHLRLVEVRFSQGLASALDVYQQRQQASATDALIPPVEARLATARHQIAVLAGLGPGAATDFSGDLPDLPPLPAAGLPADLLRRRPDVAAAGARFHAADERVAAAIANRLPALRLSGAGGTQAPDFAALLDEWFWNVAGGLTAPILDGGRRRLEVERARAARDEAWHAWRHAMLQALREVEDALELERRQAELIERLWHQREAAARTLNQARASYVNGLIDYLPVLTALDRLQQIDRTLVSARRQRGSYRVQLHRALGGGWMAELDPPAASKSGGKGERGR